MSKEDIMEGNKVMAEFLGYKYYPHTKPYGRDRVKGWVKSGLSPKNPHFSLGRSHRDFPFYNDWNALMRVIDKIESEDSVVVSIIKHSIAIHDYNKVYASTKGSTNKLKDTWAICLGYIRVKKYDNYISI